MSDYPWLSEGRRYIGLAEIPGSKHNATIQGWLAKLKAWWRDDETPWCGVFVAHCLDAAGYALPANWMRARAWSDYGRPLAAPVVGSIVVFSRAGGGHVGFVVGQDEAGNLLVLGGNQGNEVSIAAFQRVRAIAYRWPAAMPIFNLDPLPVLARASLSTSEA